MRLDQRFRKTFLKLKTFNHNEDCECDDCIKESLIGRCGMGKRYFPKFSWKTYLTNKLVLFPIYDLWLWFGRGEFVSSDYPSYKFLRWWGNRRWFGMTFIERYDYYEKLKSDLNESMLKVKKKYPNMDWEGIDDI